MGSCQSCVSGCGKTDGVRGVRKWEIAFVADCNLRCTYCNTGYGRLGGSARTMSRETWKRLIPFMLEHAAGNRRIELSFLGPGETFIRFEEFIEFIDATREAAQLQHMNVDVLVSTNGVALNEERLRACAVRGMSLRFSIDGPPEIHDAARKNTTGGASHAKAFENWRIYRRMAAAMERPPGCSVNSVIGDGSSLSIVDRYWRENGQSIFDAHIDEGSRYLGTKGIGLERRREQYLADFEAIALREANRTGVPHFLSEFSGPSRLLAFWSRLFTQRYVTSRCGVGRSTLAVAANGALFPCGSFEGFADHGLGSIQDGIDEDAFRMLATDVDELTLECNTCAAAHLCSRGCAASHPDRGLVLNSDGGCDFMRSLVRIVERSYAVLAGTASVPA